jgi:tetratricopeptide (TPR) repeat protein
LFFCCSLQAQSPHEPTVTAREATLLTQAAEVAATNMPQAVAFLAALNGPEVSAALDFAIGNFLFQDGRHEDAVAAYLAAVRKWPAFRDARKNLGRAYLLIGREQEAITVYQGLVVDGQVDADTYLLLGHGLMMKRQAVPAETAYRQALLLDPDNRDAQRGLVQALLEQERFPEVRNLLRSALDQQPREASFWSLLANVEVAAGDTAGAIRTVETARRLHACPPPLLMLLGDLYLDAGRAADAVACYEVATSAGAVEPARLLRAVEGLVQMGEAGKADALLKATVATLAPDDGGTGKTVIRLNAEIAVLQGQPRQAVALYRQLAAADPLDGRVLLRLGDLLRETGNAGEAELTYERAGRVSGFEADALVRRAHLEVDAKRFAEAAELLEAAQRLAPQPSVANYLEQIRRL